MNARGAMEIILGLLALHLSLDSRDVNVPRVTAACSEQWLVVLLLQVVDACHPSRPRGVLQAGVNIAVAVAWGDIRG
jgi:hypothetical protein